MQRFTRGRNAAAILVGLTIGILLASCAATIEGAKEIPATWTATPFSTCQDVAGAYSTHGDPAPANAYASMYNVVWPTVGSLIAMIETGANGVHQHGETTVQIVVDATGRPAFGAFDASGKALELAAREWQCLNGVLVTRALLSGGVQARESYRIDESVIRLWKASDGALIAENAVESARRSTSGPSTRRRPLARFYFRFAPAPPVTGVP